MQAIHSGRSTFYGGPSLHRLAQHIGKPRFNALARLASSALHSSFEARASTAAAAVASPSAPSVRHQSQLQPIQLIPGQAAQPRQSPFAAPVSPPRSRDIDSDLGYPTNFQDSYALGNEIGSGSFGTVYSAIERESGESVAVKILPKDQSGSGSRSRRGSGRAGRDIILNKVKKELDVLERLQVSGKAINLLGTYEDRTCVYIVMEECCGGDLETLLEDHGPLSEADAARAMYEVLQTLEACHAHNFYHGDVKPANFMLKDFPKIGPDEPTFQKTQPGQWLKAIDFGCAQYVEPGLPLTRKTGTPMFMAPEVFIGNYGLEADIWAAGMMMYQLLANRFPWWSTMEELHTTTLEAVMEAVIQKDIPMNYGHWQSFSREGFQLIQALLCRDAAGRISASDALQHPWFKKFGLVAPPSPLKKNNVLPLGRGFSEKLRLRMVSAELTRARSRPLQDLSGLLDDMLEDHRPLDTETARSTELLATFA